MRLINSSSFAFSLPMAHHSIKSWKNSRGKKLPWQIERLLCFVLLLFTFSGCANNSELTNILPFSTDPDGTMYELGLEALDNNQWLRAREYFVAIVDNYPQSPHRPDAMLGVGDAYEGQGNTESYLLAVEEFQQFLSFYPFHPRADYAQYKIGIAHYNQMGDPERDQSVTQEAIIAFELFLDEYPDSELINDTRTKLRESRDRYSQSQFLVGRFYYRLEWYPGAIARFRAILEDDPGFTNRDAVYFHLGESLLRFSTENESEALSYFERLIQEFEQSEYLMQSQTRIRELREPSQTTSS